MVGGGQNTGGMDVCQPAGGGGNGQPTQQVPGAMAMGDAPAPLSQTAPGHRDRTLVYSTVGTPDYIAPEVRFVSLFD